jgi:hypothetical protein
MLNTNLETRICHSLDIYIRTYPLDFLLLHVLGVKPIQLVQKEIARALEVDEVEIGARKGWGKLRKREIYIYTIWL